MNQAEVLYHYNKATRDPFNPDIFKRDENKIIYYLEQMLLSCQRTMGVEGYCAYCTKNNLWKNMGQLYSLTSIEDDEDPYCRNLIPSFIVYNPNPFPVQLNYIIFG